MCAEPTPDTLAGWLKPLKAISIIHSGACFLRSGSKVARQLSPLQNEIGVLKLDLKIRIAGGNPHDPSAMHDNT
jgi:hypothetical protein